MSRAEQALLSLMASRSKEVRNVRASVGDGCGTVAVAGMNNYIWIRPYNRDYPVRAYSPSGGLLPYDAVILAEVYHVGGATYYIVRGADPEIYARTETPEAAPAVGPHAQQHMYEMGGGDIVFIDGWQMSPLRVVPNNPASLSVFVARGEWWYGGTLHVWPGGESGSLASYIPSADHVRYVVVYINSSFDSIGYEASPEFADNPFLPGVYDLNIPTPPGVLVAGFVKLTASTTAITSDLIYPIRTFLTPDSMADIAQQSLFIAAKATALYKSVAGMYSWVQIGSSDAYLTAGINHLVACTSEFWVVFRQQATAVSDDPLVYLTVDGGLSFAKSQTGISFTQGSDLWKVYAVWRDPDNPYNIAIAISRIGVSTTPQVFITADGGINWTEVDNTGLPTFTCDSFTCPRTLGVESFDPVKICMALGTQGMYFKNDTASWTQVSMGGLDVYAVREDQIADDCWIALTLQHMYLTTNNWTSKVAYQLDKVDAAALGAVDIYQNMQDKRIISVAGQQGLHTTWNRSDLALAAPPIGEPGPVLRSVAGAPAMLLLTDASDNLYISTDGGLSSLASLSLTDVVAADGVAPYGLDPVMPDLSALAGFEICKAWLLGC